MPRCSEVMEEKTELEVEVVACLLSLSSSFLLSSGTFSVSFFFKSYTPTTHAYSFLTQISAWPVYM